MYDIEKIKEERQKWMTWKNIAPLREAIASLKEYENVEVTFDDCLEIKAEGISQEENNAICQAAMMMRPWRKGPFKIFDTFIDSEWKSYLKYNLIMKHVQLKGKVVADVGCNNGYYMLKMLKEEPREIIGFDPSALFKSQFDFINHFVKSDIKYELLGVEHLKDYGKKFDVIFCLGVLYHRSDPVSMLKSLKESLNSEGELILDTFVIEGEEQLCLTPAKYYSKIPNIYFVPTVNALKNWCERAGFVDFELIEMVPTTSEEQRKTEWIESESLEDFLDPSDKSKTVEGYPAPIRAYVKVKRPKVRYN